MQALEEAIGIFEQLSKLCETNGIHNSQELYKQYAAWLRELQERRKAPEIVRCTECRYFEDSDLSGYCNNPETYAIKTDADFGCILGERSTDADD